MAGSLKRPGPEAVADAVRRAVIGRGAGKSVCPSEVARSLAAAGAAPDEWRGLMGAVRDAACGLARGGEIEILRKGKPIPPDSLRGVIRLRMAAR